ncbi:short-chain dehydrogenase [Stygiobacter electus]|uniref:Short-chain dehydrogenase n=1 Tax=Stygiobacter electus TaxID=3032292 RepID=A0AAE3P1L6_9BACT|nr:short-chain dehydrogenase [Stygiobacter electus]MDF1612649.1 short-chain dehydrogenase [Stygiobacter electus]
MNIQNKTVLVLGGWGLVGNAVIRKIVPEKPKRIIVTSLKKEEAEDAVNKLQAEFPNKPNDYFVPWWGNIFVRYEFKDSDRLSLLENSDTRKILMQDTMEELNEDILQNSSIFKLMNEFKPEIVIDCINTATGIAYQDLYSTYRKINKLIQKNPAKEEIITETEKLICTLYVPQLIRHVQIMYNSMHHANTEIYIKIGTSGTGGMGLNIPYTHSEEKPSRVLLSKSSVAGAHTLLLFLMGRTPDAPITKEIKPTAAIAWKRIEFGEIKKGGKPIELINVPFENAINLENKFQLKLENKFLPTGENLKCVFIDTGENGTFSRGEFEAITAQGQMEYVTPEEIADDVIFEIKGGNTGHDIINALDNATLEPTYRAGYLQHWAVDKLDELEKIHNVNSVAFELLGPPRLSKLLHEINILKNVFGSMKNIVNQKPEKLSEGCFEYLKKNEKLKNEIISIGIPILFPDGKKLLRGNEIKIPPFRGENELDINETSINLWANDGWVDLRVKNMIVWQQRLNAIINEAESINPNDTSSMHVRTKKYWNNFETIDIGKVVGWIFIKEEKGERMKA